MSMKKLNLENPVSIDLSRKFRINQIDSRYDLRKLSFDLWLELGNLEAVYKELDSKGYTNRYGRPHAVSSIRLFAHDYIVNYPDEARAKYQEFDKFIDSDDGDKEWLWYLVNIAARHRNLHGKDSFLRWTLKHGIYKSAFEYFKNTYNLTDEDYHAFDGISDD